MDEDTIEVTLTKCATCDFWGNRPAHDYHRGKCYGIPEPAYAFEPD